MANLIARTTKQLATSFVNGIVLALDSAESTLPKSFIRILGDVSAGSHVVLHKYAGFALLQQFARFATYEEITVLGEKFRPLVLLGRRLGVDDPLLGSAAQVSLTCTSATGSGDPVPAGTQLLGENDLTYEVVSETPVSSSFSLLVRCLETGAVGDVASGEMEFVEPLDNVSRVAAISGLTVPGVDDETEDAYRERVVSAEEAQPQGGSYADYRRWAEGVASVRRAFPYTGNPGEIDLYIEGGDAPDYIPSTALLQAVQIAVEENADGLAQSRPINDAVNYFPISRVPINIEITGFSGSDSDKAEIETAIDERLRSRRPFIQGLDVLPRQDLISSADIGGIASEVASSLGISFSSLAINIAGSGVVSLYILQPGQLAKAGTASYL